MLPTSVSDGCRVLVEGVSFSRPEAQRALGADMLDALMGLGYAWTKGGRYAATDAGRRRALAERPVEETA
jgi:hypothetical protein